ncbi:DUF654-domain-containing protein [Jaminaea rosea]|uniref:DUF654-domain-containing protein n=1 Tax=Jaminaea rosea TaxID=1569628 RepID=A0A316UZU4_9BASI|nr:DUF654-domain-containing protein [Jaminaea rosea]PWN29831.1 DUF654-domain-containing protein [Jaminaea rosea]
MAAKRLNKRQAREQQELSELAAVKPAPTEEEEPEQEEEEEEGEKPQAPAAQSIFAALNAGEDGAGSEEEEDDEEGGDEEQVADTKPAASKKKKNKKKKKKSKAKPAEGEEVAAEADEASASAASMAAKKKSKANTPSGGTAPTKGLSEMSLDDFDSLLSSQPHMKAGGGSGSATGSAAPSTSAAAGGPSSLRSSLTLNPSNLDPSIELKRQFGSAAIKAFEASNAGTDGEGGTGGAGAQRAARGAKARMMARNPNLKARSVLVQPREDWPPIARTFTGIQGELIDDEDSGEKMATWTHSKAYRTAQYEFQAAVATYDPNSIYALFRPYPWHIHLLSSLSDIAKHQGDLAQAADWNARILFAFERTAATQWVGSLTSGGAAGGPMRVDFDKVENRALWLAVHRNVGFLGRRGTWRTALEWSKLLLALEPERDPHGALLWIDFLAVKSSQHQWLVDDFLPALRKKGKGKEGSNADWLGGLAFAEALAVRAMEADEKQGKKKSGSATSLRSSSSPSSTDLLKRAIHSHSYMLSALASKTALPPLSPKLGVQDPNDVQEILAQLYALRSESLWKDADNRDWLQETLKSVESEGGIKASDSGAARPTEEQVEGVYRHVIASDLPDALRTQLLSCLPRSIAKDEANLNAHDPLPPSKLRGAAVTRVDEEYFAPLFGQGRTQRGTAAGQRGGTEDDVEMGEGIMGRLAAFAAGRLRGWFQQQQQQGGQAAGEGDAAQQDGGDPAELQDALMAALGSLPEAEREAMRRIITEGAEQEGAAGEENEDDEDDAEEYEEVLDSEEETFEQQGGNRA